MQNSYAEKMLSWAEDLDVMFQSSSFAMGIERTLFLSYGYLVHNFVGLLRYRQIKSWIMGGLDFKPCI